MKIISLSDSKFDLGNPLSVKISIILILLVSFFVVMHLICYYLMYLGFQNDTDRGYEIFHKLFFLDAEKTVPAWFSSCMLWTSGIGVLVISALEQDKFFKKYWFIIGLSLLYVSLDEMISLHEHGSKIVDSFIFRNIQLPDFLYFSWVIPAMVLILIFFVYLIPFFANLERQIRLLLYVSASIYLFGAVCCEMFGGYFAVNSMETFYRFACTLEETLEMIGVVVFFHVISSVALHKYKELVLISAK